ncbi:hypothetical protein GCM10010269_16080 [Streptomyces humidus]|uniref:Aminoglycoside phosphotransferase domain-containing protein n=1 Tax=Streptomyces humidus TaxID=52259 RepID=A0A918FTW5_9ACTN|nr:hypothetical protein GCM10010269_16080 [Streptomyces humidus]
MAAAVFRRQGVDFRSARRAAGWTNATWIGGGVAVRIAGSAAARDLVRETELAALLPAEVGCPAVLDSGAEQGHEWVVTREIAATSLDDAWAALGGEQRVSATRQLWERARARAVHRVDREAAARVARARNPFYTRDPDEADASLARLQAAGVLSAGERVRLSAILDRHWAALDGAAPVLNHGDLSPVNALWDGSDVVSLLDFEFAVLAPVQLDLNELVKTAWAPSDRDSAPTARESADRALLQEAVTWPARCWAPTTRWPCSSATRSSWSAGAWNVNWPSPAGRTTGTWSRTGCSSPARTRTAAATRPCWGVDHRGRTAAGER